jgi:ubiquinone/menaquinone biosynthesis C-methylase UbiE
VAARASERIRRAVDGLSIGPGDRVLELGCGHGVAADLVCRRLESGHLTAIDRSPKMIAAARRRNATHVEAGKATFLCTTIEDADLGDQRFDKVFGIHFPPYRRDPAAVRALVEPLLAPGGVARFL